MGRAARLDTVLLSLLKSTEIDYILFIRWKQKETLLILGVKKIHFRVRIERMAIK